MKRGGYDFYDYALNAKEREHTDVPLLLTNGQQLEKL
jgi:sRNA-binding regulator protein Hfq